MYRMILTMCICACCGSAIAHETMSLDELLESFGMDLATAEVRAEALAPGLHVLFGAGGNVIVSIGDQGVLMVDSQFPEMIPKLKSAISQLGGADVDFVINTHWHFDHADGNPALGREGSWMISHTNSRRMMTGEHAIDLVSRIYNQPPSPAEALPVVTYEDAMQLHFNGQRIDLVHFGAAHTTGDTAVIFRGSNVVHMGDVFNAGYPFIDAGNGGDIDGMIRFCRSVLKRIDTDTRIVPGHGPVKTYADLQSYVAMLQTVSDRITAMIDSGMTLEEVMEAGPTQEFDDEYGSPQGLINRAYVSLSR